MAGFGAIAAAGRSIERLLSSCLQAEPRPVPNQTTRAVLIRTDDFEQTGIANVIQPPAISLFLYRVDFSKTMRAPWSGVGAHDGRGHLALDLHYLLTPWASDAEFEHRILGRAMQCLEATPVLSGPLLHSSTEWAANESLQIVLEELSTEAIMRTFDSLDSDYRLSVAYVVRTLRIDTVNAALAPPVTTAISGAVPIPS